MANNDTNSNEPDALSVYNQFMEPLWDLTQSLRAGTQAMRDGGVKYLPKEPKEAPAKYKMRLNRTFLFNAYDETISSIAAKPFTKEVKVIGDDKNEFVEKIKENVDKEGRNITQFCKDIYDSGVDRGMVLILVDFPNNVDEDGKALSLGSERSEDIRPCFVEIDRQNLLGYRESEEKPGTFDMIRIREQRKIPDGNFGECLVDFIRVIEPDQWRVYESSNDDSNAKNNDNEPNNWKLHSSGVNTLGEVPLVPIYMNRTAFMEADPALKSLAWLNQMHWQSSSDQNNILRFARTGTFFGSGFSKDEIKTQLVVGVDNMIKSTSADAKLTVVEFNGKAIEAGSADLKQIEDRMEMLGAQPMIAMANTTATGSRIEANKKETFAESWVRVTESGVEKAYGFAYKWYGQEMPEDFKIEIFSDFGADVQTDNSIDKIFDAQDKGLLTNETVLEEMQRRDILSSKVDIEKELVDAAGEMEGRMALIGGLNEEEEEQFDADGNPIEDPEIDQAGE